MILWIAIMIAGEIGMFNSLSSSGYSYPYYVGIAMLFIGAMGAVCSHKRTEQRITRLERKVDMVRKGLEDELQSTED